MSEDPPFTLEGVTRMFGSFAALRDVSVTGSFQGVHGLLGRNGAGKTTLLQILTGQDQPSSGRVTAFGSDPFENADVLDLTCFIRESQRYPEGSTPRQVLRAAPWFSPNWS